MSSRLIACMWLIGILMAAVPVHGFRTLGVSDAIMLVSPMDIPDQVVQELSRERFPINACTDAGTVTVGGSITQSDPVPSKLNVILRQLDPDGNLLQEHVFAINVDDTGSIQMQSFPALGGCVNANDQLSVLVQPQGGSIAVGAEVSFGYNYVIPQQMAPRK